MKLLTFILTCMLAPSSVFSFSNSAFLVDGLTTSQVYLCTQNQSEYKENIQIKVQTKNEEVCITPTINYGYEPSILLADFIGNGLSQIFYQVNSGGSGAYSSYQIISMQNGKQKTIYDSENFQNTAQASLVEQLVKIEYLNQNYYLETGNADLSGEKNIVVSNINAVMPIYNGGLNKYQIAQFQKVYIDYTANNIGYLVCLIDLNPNGITTVSVGTLAGWNINYTE